MSAQESGARLAGLDPSEIGDLFVFLFRRMYYRVRETLPYGSLFYIHLVEPKENQLKHVLACWTPDKKDLNNDFLDKFFQKSLFVLLREDKFEKGILISPFGFSEEFQKKAKSLEIDLLDGKSLLELFNLHEIRYELPTPSAVLRKHLWKKLPLVTTPLFILFAFLTYKALIALERPGQSFRPLPSPSPSIVETAPPSQPTTPSPNIVTPTPEPSSPLPASPSASPTSSPTEEESSTPSPVSSTEKSTYPAASPTPSPLGKANPGHKPSARQSKQEHPKASAAPKQAPRKQETVARQIPQPTKEAPKGKVRSGKSKELPYESTKRVTGRVVRHYSNMFDLQERYYRIARDLENRHLKTQAKSYYQKYLNIAPDGSHADEAKQAIEKLKTQNGK